MIGLEGVGGQDTSFAECVQDRVAGRAGGRIGGGGGGVGGGRERFTIQHCKPVPSRYNPATKLDVHLVIALSFPVCFGYGFSFNSTRQSNASLLAVLNYELHLDFTILSYLVSKEPQ